MPSSQIKLTLQSSLNKPLGSSNMPSPGPSAALSLVSGLASMASSMAASAPPVTTVAAAAATTATPASVSTAMATAISISAGAGIVTNGISNTPMRRPSRIISQKSLERTRSKEDIQKHPPPDAIHRRPRDHSRDRSQRKKSENDDDRPPPRSGSFSMPPTANRRPSRICSDDTKPPPPRPQPQEKPQRPNQENQGPSAESSESEDPVTEGMRRGRRKSIVRQQSYDDEAEDPALLWVGNLPARRHSSQDPSRNTENRGLHSSRDSLDVPQGRIARHHSWDYDSVKDGSNTLLPG